MSQFDDFITQIKSLPDLVPEVVATMEPPARTVLSTPEIYGVRHIILTGSGDSYFAAAAVAPAMRAWTGLPVQVMTAMEAARYVDAGRSPRAGAKGLLVLAISYSGEAARVVEAVRRLRAFGAVTVALTANPESRLGQAAARVLDTRIADSTAAPGTRNYVASMIGLYLVAIRLAEVAITMTMDVANELRGEISAIGLAIQSTTGLLMPAIDALAQEWKGYRTMDLLGSGPSLASASYAAAKLVEAAGLHATAQDAEEFHHLNYFVDKPDETPTIVFAPSHSLARSRTDELISALEQLGRPYRYVTDVAGAGNKELVVPAVREWFAPIVQTIPAALIAAYSARERGVPHYRGHTGPWRGAQGAGFVKNSSILTLEEQVL